MRKGDIVIAKANVYTAYWFDPQDSFSYYSEPIEADQVVKQPYKDLCPSHRVMYRRKFPKAIKCLVLGINSYPIGQRYIEKEYGEAGSVLTEYPVFGIADRIRVFMVMQHPEDNRYYKPIACLEEDLEEIKNELSR